MIDGRLRAYTKKDLPGLKRERNRIVALVASLRDIVSDTSNEGLNALYKVYVQNSFYVRVHADQAVLTSLCTNLKYFRELWV